MIETSAGLAIPRENQALSLDGDGRVSRLVALDDDMHCFVACSELRLTRGVGTIAVPRSIACEHCACREPGEVFVLLGFGLPI